VMTPATPLAASVAHQTPPLPTACPDCGTDFQRASASGCGRVPSMCRMRNDVGLALLAWERVLWSREVMLARRRHRSSRTCLVELRRVTHEILAQPKGV